MSINLKKTIRALRKGNQLAGFQLYQQFSRATYNSILRIVAEEDLARDLLQESFIQAFSKIDTLENEQAFGGWLKRIAINQALVHLRSEKDKWFSLDNLPEAILEAEEIEIPEIPFDAIQTAINQLPVGCRTVFNLYYLEEYSHAEIAQELNTSLSNSKTQLRYAKQLLQEKLRSAYETS